MLKSFLLSLFSVGFLFSQTKPPLDERLNLDVRLTPNDNGFDLKKLLELTVPGILTVAGVYITIKSTERQHRDTLLSKFKELRFERRLDGIQRCLTEAIADVEAHRIAIVEYYDLDFGSKNYDVDTGEAFVDGVQRIKGYEKCERTGRKLELSISFAKIILSRNFVRALEDSYNGLNKVFSSIGNLDTRKYDQTLREAENSIEILISAARTEYALNENDDYESPQEA